MLKQPFGLQFPQLPSDLHYYLSVQYVAHSNHYAPTRDAYRFGNYLAPPVVLTDWLPSLSTPSACRSLSMPFQLMALHDPLRDYSPPILPLCIQYIQPTCRVCTLHDPRRLWKVADSNRLLIYSIRGPPLNAGEGDAHLFHLPVCTFIPAFPSFISATSCRHTLHRLCSELS